MAFAEADPTLTDERLGLKIERCHRAGQSLTGSPTSHANSRVAGASRPEPATHGCLSMRHRTDKHLATEGLQAGVLHHILSASEQQKIDGCLQIPWISGGAVAHRNLQQSQASAGDERSSKTLRFQQWRIDATRESSQ